MRFTKEKGKRDIEPRNMIEPRDSIGKIMILLLVSSIFLAALHSTNRVGAGNEVSADGTIEVYDSDGKKPLTDYDFPLFMGGIEDTFRKSFFINNTGTNPVEVYWNVTASSILWQLTGSLHQHMYDHYEDSIWKYSLGISKDIEASPKYWQPNQEAILLAVSEGVKLQFELYYTGTPNTAGTFTITISFHAKAPTIPGDVNDDGKVSVFDLYALGKAYNSTPGTPNWNPNADLNNDLIINAEDLSIMNDNYGHSV